MRSVRCTLACKLQVASLAQSLCWHRPFVGELAAGDASLRTRAELGYRLLVDNKSVVHKMWWILRDAQLHTHILSFLMLGTVCLRTGGFRSHRAPRRQHECPTFPCALRSPASQPSSRAGLPHQTIPTNGCRGSAAERRGDETIAAARCDGRTPRRRLKLYRFRPSSHRHLHSPSNHGSPTPDTLSQPASMQISHSVSRLRSGAPLNVRAQIVHGAALVPRAVA